MIQAVKGLAFKMYKFINCFPFNNKRKGEIYIENDGAVLLRCKIISIGTGNSLIIHAGGGYSVTAILPFMGAITRLN